MESKKIFAPLILIITGITASSSVIFIKLCNIDSFYIAGLRLLIASSILFPFWLINKKKKNFSYTKKKILKIMIPSAALSFHLITWTIGAKLTLATNATILINLLPLIMPFFLYFFTHERINKYETIGTILGLIGIFYLAFNDYHLQSDKFQGDIICLISLFFLALYLISAKRFLQDFDLLSYIVPVYFFASIITLLSAIVFNRKLEIPDTQSVLALIALVIFPTIMGHSLLNFSMRRFRGQIVSLANQLQFIYAGFMGYFILKEIPDTHFYITAIFVVAGSFIAIIYSTYD